MTRQDKQKEIAFFDGYAAVADYDVFTPAARERLIATFVRSSGLAPGARVADLGCGSGTSTHLLAQAGYASVGLDLSARLLAAGRRRHPTLALVAGDIEQSPFPDQSFDGLLLCGVVHHFPDPSRCAAEMFRLLRPGGRFVALDPNRMNPFMWLYRDRTSPFYSPLGVTENERPVLADELAAVFSRAGFLVSSHYLAGLAYRYVASARVRRLLPLYNLVDSAVFSLGIMERLRPFVLTVGTKPMATCTGVASRSVAGHSVCT
jgi:ubiquinone/menaquinone biosynthesis C-methylase UbiE